ncbi:MAG: hypothetical protein ACRET4_12735 [Steroidobacteraceae bacterium]
MISKCRRLTCLLLLAAITAACGGGGSSGGGFQSTPSSAGGFWQGTTTADGATQDIYGFVAESRLFHFIRADGAQFYGTLTITGNDGTASFTGLAPPGTTFADGSTRGTGTLTATIQTRSQLNITGSFTTANNTTSNLTMMVQYDAGYEPDSALASVGGNYAAMGAPPGTDSFSISNTGVVTYSDNTGCMANGTVTLIDSQWNLYNVEFTFSNCPVPAQNGLQVQGLLTIDLTQDPDLLILAVHGTVQGVPIAFLFAYQRA